MEAPPVQYTKVRDGWVAYQALGEGPRDFVYVPGFAGNLDLWWDSPIPTRLFTYLADYGRVVLLDRRGQGLSDRLPEGASILEEWTFDAIGVMDAVGSTSATVIAFDTGTPMALYTAATFPERVDGLILMEGYAVSALKDVPEATVETIVQWVESEWGTGNVMRSVSPGTAVEWASNDLYNKMMGRMERMSLHKGEVAANLRALNEVDVREALSSVRAPALLINSTHDVNVPFELAVALHEALPGSTLVPIESRDMHGWMNELELVFSAIDGFLGVAHAPPSGDRVLATVLFSDIVGSTERAAAAGDRRWRTLLNTHDEFVRSCVGAEEGRIVKSTGDGVLATFDGPAKAIRAARAIRDSVQALGIAVYQGLHTGEVDRRGEDISGLAVHIAARVGKLAQPGEVLVTRTVKDLVVGSGFEFIDRGVHALKGVPDDWQLYAIG